MYKILLEKLAVLGFVLAVALSLYGCGYWTMSVKLTNNITARQLSWLSSKAPTYMYNEEMQVYHSNSNMYEGDGKGN